MKSIATGLNTWFKKMEVLRAARDGEYADGNGNIRCCKCHEKTVAKVILENGRTMFVPALCLCKKEPLRKTEELIKEHKLRITRDQIFSGTFSRYKRCNVNTDDKNNLNLSNCIKKYIDNFDKFYNRGRGLLLYGTPGCGKTFAAAAIINGVIEQDNIKWQRPYNCCITNFATIADQHLSSNPKGLDDIYKQLNSKDLLVIDDWGTERNTPFMKEIVTKVINNRYNANKPLIITTNLDVKNVLKQLKEIQELDKKNIRKMTEEEIYLSRIYSRFFEMCMFIQVIGKDRRNYGII